MASWLNQYFVVIPAVEFFYTNRPFPAIDEAIRIGS
jgi:hypothetical protein